MLSVEDLSSIFSVMAGRKTVWQQGYRFAAIRDEVAHYYNEKLKLYGPTAMGVDWNSAEAQEHRFEQLLRNCNLTTGGSVNDYGCGYGALVGYMIQRDYKFEYRGFDISEEMIAQAREMYGELTNCEFFSDTSRLRRSDYTVASGIFNVRLQASDDEWLHYIFDTLATLNKLSKKGFAFNALTRYSDKDLMRPDLYYADPLILFDYCKRNFSKFVSLFHDYPFYDFTISVKKVMD